MGRKFGIVHGVFWEDERIRSMSDAGRLMALYLMTCKHQTIIGAFHAPAGYIFEDTGWSIETVPQRLGEAVSEGFAKRCETSKWVWLPNHFRWNPLENPNQRKAAAKMALLIPTGVSWREEFMLAHGEMLGLSTVRKSNGCETVPKGKPNQEQEQEQEQNQEQGTGTVAPAKLATVGGTPVAPPAADAPATRGTRLSPDWVLTKAWAEEVLAEHKTWTEETVRVEAERFRDFWIGKTGKDATKLDWRATWRNWCRSAKPQAALLKSAKKTGLSNEELARRIAERRGGGHAG